MSTVAMLNFEFSNFIFKRQFSLVARTGYDKLSGIRNLTFRYYIVVENDWHVSRLLICFPTAIQQFDQHLFLFRISDTFVPVEIRLQISITFTSSIRVLVLCVPVTNMSVYMISVEHESHTCWLHAGFSSKICIRSCTFISAPPHSSSMVLVGTSAKWISASEFSI